jgi:hypothetical protein
MMPHQSQLVNVRKAEKAGIVTMRNGTQEDITEVGEVVGLIHDKEKNKNQRYISLKKRSFHLVHYWADAYKRVETYWK